MQKILPLLIALSQTTSSVQTPSLKMTVVHKYGWETLAEATRPLTARERALGGGIIGGITGFTVGPDGRIYISDGPNHKIVVFAREGSLAAVWGGPGKGPGEFMLPVSPTMSPDGTLFVLDLIQNRITALNADGGYASGYQVPGSLCTGLNFANGLVWVDHMVKPPQRMLLGLDPRTGAIRDSAMSLNEQESDIAMHGSTPRMFSDGQTLYAASNVPGIWRTLTGKAATYGAARFPDAHGYEQTTAYGSRRNTTDQIQGFAVMSTGAAVIAYRHTVNPQTNSRVDEKIVNYIEIIAPNGSSRGRLTLDEGQVIRGVAIDGSDILLGITDEVPQIWRVRLSTN